MSPKLTIILHSLALFFKGILTLESSLKAIHDDFLDQNDP
jgi:hypothetical protein